MTKNIIVSLILITIGILGFYLYGDTPSNGFAFGIFTGSQMMSLWKDITK